jgi:hypothetical protein
VQAPGDLWFDAAGSAIDIPDAGARFTDFARDVAAVIALVSNAATAPLEPELIFEIGSGLVERDYFQRWLEPDKVAGTSRFIDAGATSSVIGAVAAHPDRDRLVRAISQYSQALGWCRTGYELLAMAHLFMGAESLKKAAWQHLLATSGSSADQLAREWGFKDNGRESLEQFLDQQARVRLVFKNDSGCHKAAKHVSDHFEHSFSNAASCIPPLAKI